MSRESWSIHFGDGGTNTDPDGNALAFSFNLRYPGQYYDGIEQIYYNYYRDYDSRTGRYLQPDPIGLAGGVSMYGYVGGNPLLSIDPMGLQALPAGSPIPPPSGPPLINYGPAANDAVYGARGVGFRGLVGRAGAVGFAAWAGWEAGEAINDAYGEEIGRGVDAVCRSEREIPDDCAGLIAKINIAKNGIARRFRQLRENKGGINQDTHWGQLRGRQANLRKLLNEALVKGCPIPPDAWTWATMQ